MRMASRIVRQATSNDIPEILGLYKASLDEMGEDYQEHLLVKKIINSYNLAPCFLLVIDDIIAGMAGMTVVTIAHSGVATLADYMFYVLPEYRNSKNLGGLTKAVKDFAKEHNMPVRLEFISNNNDENLRKRVLRMHGFDTVCVVGGLR